MLFKKINNLNISLENNNKHNDNIKNTDFLNLIEYKTLNLENIKNKIELLEKTTDIYNYLKNNIELKTIALENDNLDNNFIKSLNYHNTIVEDFIGYKPIDINTKNDIKISLEKDKKLINNIFSIIETIIEKINNDYKDIKLDTLDIIEKQKLLFTDIILVNAKKIRDKKIILNKDLEKEWEEKINNYRSMFIVKNIQDIVKVFISQSNVIIKNNNDLIENLIQHPNDETIDNLLNYTNNFNFLNTNLKITYNIKTFIIEKEYLKNNIDLKPLNPKDIEKINLNNIHNLLEEFIIKLIDFNIKLSINKYKNTLLVKNKDIKTILLLKELLNLHLKLSNEILNNSIQLLKNINRYLRDSLIVAKKV